MDNLNRNKTPANDDQEKPIPFDEEPIPFDIAEEAPKPPPTTGVSHAPLSLSGQAVTPGAKPAPAKAPPPKIQVNLPQTRKAAPVSPSADRITGIKTFFTKLHPGAIPFMDEQISDWLKSNPGVRVKMTNAVVGEIQSKKTEPNIIITIWY